MTKAKTHRKTRGLYAEQTLINLTKRLKSEPESTAKRLALTNAIKLVVQLLHMANWRAATAYRLATALTIAEDDAERLRAVEELVTILDSGLPGLAEQPDFHALAAGLTQILRAAGFRADEIAALVDDGRGGSTEQRQHRARSRLSGSPTESIARFWATALVNDKTGTPNSR